MSIDIERFEDEDPESIGNPTNAERVLSFLARPLVERAVDDLVSYVRAGEETSEIPHLVLGRKLGLVWLLVATTATAL